MVACSVSSVHAPSQISPSSRSEDPSCSSLWVKSWTIGANLSFSARTEGVYRLAREVSPAIRASKVSRMVLSRLQSAYSGLVLSNQAGPRGAEDRIRRFRRVLRRVKMRHVESTSNRVLGVVHKPSGGRSRTPFRIALGQRICLGQSLLRCNN